jgi:hypothetical protein
MNNLFDFSPINSWCQYKPNTRCGCGSSNALPPSSELDGGRRKEIIICRHPANPRTPLNTRWYLSELAHAVNFSCALSANVFCQLEVHLQFVVVPTGIPSILLKWGETPFPTHTLPVSRNCGTPSLVTSIYQAAVRILVGEKPALAYLVEKHLECSRRYTGRPSKDHPGN